MFQILGICTGYLGGSTGIPGKLAQIISLIYRGIQIVVPVLLILWGMLDLGKAVMAQKEEEIKKGQQTFIKRIVAAAIVFFVFTIVELLVGLVSDSGSAEKNGKIDDSTLAGCIRMIIKCKSYDSDEDTCSQ